jgi:hypothetical protein
MRLLIVESRLVNIVSKFIGELHELSVSEGKETYFLDKNNETVFIYNNYSEELDISTDVVHNVCVQLGVPFKDLKHTLKKVGEHLTGKQTSNLGFF